MTDDYSETDRAEATDSEIQFEAVISYEDGREKKVKGTMPKNLIATPPISIANHQPKETQMTVVEGMREEIGRLRFQLRCADGDVAHLRAQLMEQQKATPAKPEHSFIQPWEMSSGWSYRLTFDSVYDEADSLIARVIDADGRGELTNAARNIRIEEIDPIEGSDD